MSDVDEVVKELYEEFEKIDDPLSFFFRLRDTNACRR